MVSKGEIHLSSGELNLFHFILSSKAKIIYVSFILNNKYILREVKFVALLLECMKDIDC